jgi:hypothetical protein
MMAQPTWRLGAGYRCLGVVAVCTEVGPAGLASADLPKIADMMPPKKLMVRSMGSRNCDTTVTWMTTPSRPIACGELFLHSS